MNNPEAMTDQYPEGLISFWQYKRDGLLVVPAYWEPNDQVREKRRYCCGALGICENEELTSKLEAGVLSDNVLSDIWPEDEHADILLPTGTNRLFAILIRTYRGIENLKILEKSLGSLPSTLSIAMGAFGEIRLYKRPEGCIGFREDILPGISFYGDHGAVPAPPSRLFDGSRCEWVGTDSFSREAIQNLPESWGKFVKDSTEYFFTKKNSEVEVG